MTVVAVIIGVVVMALLWKPIFGSAGNFWDCLKFWIKPDFISMFQGEWMEDFVAELKLGLWFAAGIGSGYAVFSFFS